MIYAMSDAYPIIHPMRMCTEHVGSHNPSATIAAIRRELSLVKNALTAVLIRVLRIIIAIYY